MTKKSHNKKRNVGIVYEQLVYTLSKALVEDNFITANNTKKIIKKFFKPGTELYKEHKLFKALVNVEIKDGSLATKILEEAKYASKNFNASLLNKEKSRLIKEINYTLGKEVYSSKLSQYKKFATVQSTLDMWRTKNPDISKLALYESKCHDILMEAKVETDLETLKTPEAETLVVKIMTEKFNQKYKNLDDTQKMLIKEYVFFQSGQKNSFLHAIKNIKQKTLNEISRYNVSSTNKFVNTKLNEVKNDIEKIDVTNVKDDTIAKFMQMCQLVQELETNDE